MQTNKESEKNYSQVTGEPGRMIPKLATGVSVTKTDGNNYLLTFVTGLDGETKIVIDRIVLEGQTMSGLIKLVQDMENNKEEGR